MALTTATLLALSSSVIGGGINLIQAEEAREFKEKSDKAAKRLLSNARTKVQKDYYEGLKIPMEAYEQAELATLQQQQQNIQALQQADSRTLASGVGRAGMLANQQTEQIRAMKAKEMFDLEKMKAENKDDMNQQLIQMDVAAAQDKAARAAQADERIGMLQAGAANAIVGGITSAASAQALNPLSDADKALAKTFSDNEQLFIDQNISRSDFMMNPKGYKIENGVLKVLNSNVVNNVKTIEDLNKDLLYKEDDSKNIFDFQRQESDDRMALNSVAPSVNYGFSFQDRLDSFENNNALS